MNELITTQDHNSIIKAVLDTLVSPHTKRKYALALDDFISWLPQSGFNSIDRQTVNAYKTHMIEYEVGGIGHRLVAIRKLAKEAYHAGAINDRVYLGIMDIEAPKHSGKSVGNWLTKTQAIAVLRKPDTNTLKGLRDRAILAVFLGAGLRRSEAASLTFEHIQQREGRWVIIDLVGKGNKTRTIPIASWTYVAIEEWQDASGLTGSIFVSINKGDNISGDSISPQAMRNICIQYAGMPAHDLRRTYAKLAHSGHADLMQISLSLGHDSIETTTNYIGAEQNMTNSPADNLGLKLA